MLLAGNSWSSTPTPQAAPTILDKASKASAHTSPSTAVPAKHSFLTIHVKAYPRYAGVNAWEPCFPTLIHNTGATAGLIKCGARKPRTVLTAPPHPRGPLPTSKSRAVSPRPPFRHDAGGSPHRGGAFLSGRPRPPPQAGPGVGGEAAPAARIMSAPQLSFPAPPPTGARRRDPAWAGDAAFPAAAGSTGVRSGGPGAPEA
ncbi:hypothetical protein NDU88_001977 [Pleurodeles waltl]|uniref:Uncharacterized protein n=1 Tax=Pleurodeles waltl TaxID=8319 RepID=A0AAV7UBU8_PLEWA|nr:hypothetical protein NDU88_001977 [Pleurodeles waltl]